MSFFGEPRRDPVIDAFVRAMKSLYAAPQPRSEQMSEHPNMPPGADAELLEREREDAEAEKRMADIEKAIRDDPRELMAYLDENEIARRLARMLTVCRDHEAGRTIYPAEVCAKMMREWDAARAEAMDAARKLEGL